MGFKRFYLNRGHDVSGISGTGRVAEGVLFSDGTCVIRWTTKYRSTVVYASIEEAESVHGHGGSTVVEWVDGGSAPAPDPSRAGTGPPEEVGPTAVYADGACIGNPGPMGIGIAAVLPDGSVVERGEHIGHGTNNVAELRAVQRVLELFDPGSRLTVHTDSQYAIGVLSKGWKAKANQDLVRTIRDRLSLFPDLEFVHVRGHSGDPLNERADELANRAARDRA